MHIVQGKRELLIVEELRGKIEQAYAVLDLIVPQAEREQIYAQITELTLQQKLLNQQEQLNYFKKKLVQLYFGVIEARIAQFVEVLKLINLLKSLA